MLPKPIAYNIIIYALLIDTPLKSASVQLHDSQMFKASTHFYGLQSQGFSAQTVAASIKKSEIVAWCNCIGSLSETLHNFARKAYSSSCLLHQICASGNGTQIQTAFFANKVFHKPTNTYSRIALPQLHSKDTRHDTTIY